GSLEVGSGGTVNFNSGTLTAALIISGNFSYGFAITPSQLSVRGGDFACLFPLTLPGNFSWQRGTISGPETLTVRGDVSLGASSNSLTLDGATLVFEGTGELGANSLLNFRNASHLEVAAGATFTKTSSANVIADGPDNEFHNLGTLRFTSTQNQLWFVPLRNRGRMEVTTTADVNLAAGGDLRQSTVACPAGGDLILNGGTFRLDGIAYTAAAALAVTGATVQIDGTEDLPVALTFGPSSTLSGTGTAIFSGTPPVLNGKIAPGNSPGTLFLGPNLDLDGTTLEMEVTDGGFDQLVVPGDLQLGGNLRVMESGTVADGDYLILRCDDVDCLTGNFANTSLPPDYRLDITGTEVRLIKGAALPIRWSSFTVATAGKEHVLRWSTETETNHRGFYVERATDGEF
ncbi:MAG: hypothetical protein AAFN92_20745, partial [Bacteroidota bacterium]